MLHFPFCTQCHYPAHVASSRRQEHVMADEPVVSTGAARDVLDTDEPDADELLDADLLVEEVSIDGMCGVY
jgi:mycofactocin precursor